MGSQVMEGAKDDIHCGSSSQRLCFWERWFLIITLLYNKKNHKTRKKLFSLFKFYFKMKNIPLRTKQALNVSGCWLISYPNSLSQRLQRQQESLGLL